MKALVRGENSLVPDEVKIRRRHQSSQTTQEFDFAQVHARRTVRHRFLESHHQSAALVALEALQGERRPQSVLAQSFQGGPIVRVDVSRRLQGEALDLGQKRALATDRRVA